MKSFTDIEQSKQLTEMLPIESADGFYEKQFNPTIDKWEYILFTGNKWAIEEAVIPCWSLAALLEVMPKEISRYTKTLYWSDDAWYCEYMDEDFESKIGVWADNPVDSCVEMIIKLREKDLL